MRLETLLHKAGNTLVVCRDAPIPWIFSLAKSVRQVKFLSIILQHKKISRCIYAAWLLSIILLACNILPIKLTLSSAAIATTYWLVTLFISKIVMAARSHRLSSQMTRHMEMCFCKGTIRTLPDGCYIIKSPEGTIPVLYKPSEIKEHKDEEGFYAVCRGFSIIVATPVNLAKVTEGDDLDEII